ncbi:PhzF family phenazine biosynthesis protein [Lampropedia puyangensis]|uniref:PhzF family phenazine biosynthesis protein n=1 Tax=Lampropedia puyangensis TaxID=1330072 RepID=A0A4S8F5V1_9BURK|nr:PhzF family phenazine biosynthesis protein [Lampropedia puyangensis]THU02800.1 PhzF family phenazine biosynthesis protein [Lampropedia puyangensis]
MQQRRFAQVDVFTNTPYRGNPLAVVLDAQGLSTAQMQDFARWTNLSETTFVLPAEHSAADYRVRIFTPDEELPFAGHPTLGTCFAWLAAGGVPKATDGRVTQQCIKGLVRLRPQPHASGLWSFEAPALQRSQVDHARLSAVANALGLSNERIVAHQLLDNGPQWLVLVVPSAQEVMALRPDFAALRALKADVGVVALGDRHASNTPQMPFLTVRGFATAMGIPEDPVTGSLNASLAQWLIHEGWAPARYWASQGETLGRAGRIFCEQDENDRVWVGGHTVLCIQGLVTL